MRDDVNKLRLVANVQARLGLSHNAAADAIDAVFATIARAVANGEKVVVPGFGTFEARVRAPRVARNPRTGGRVAVPATSVPAFRPSAAFRNAVAGRSGRARRR
jgi:DNA-binding protein HU-beta